MAHLQLSSPVATVPIGINTTVGSILKLLSQLLTLLEFPGLVSGMATEDHFLISVRVANHLQVQVLAYLLLD
jgi:hypothetical protein